MIPSKTGLESIADRINRDLNTPLTYFHGTDPATRTINVGHYHLTWDYNQPSLVRTLNIGGGIEVIINRCSKPEMYQRLWAFIRGYQIGKETKS